MRIRRKSSLSLPRLYQPQEGKSSLAKRLLFLSIPSGEGGSVICLSDVIGMPINIPLNCLVASGNLAD